MIFKPIYKRKYIFKISLTDMETMWLYDSIMTSLSILISEYFDLDWIKKLSFN